MSAAVEGYRAGLAKELDYAQRTGDKAKAAEVEAELALLDAPVEPPEPVVVTDDGGEDDPEVAAKPKRKAPAKKDAQ